MVSDKASVRGLAELAEGFIDDTIRRYSHLAGSGEEAKARARYEIAVSSDLKTILELFNEEVETNAPVLDTVVTSLIGMLTKSSEKGKKTIKPRELQEVLAICQNQECDVTRTGVGYFAHELPEEDIVFRPEDLVYSDAGEKFRNDMMYCRGCKEHSITTRRDAKIQILRKEEGDDERVKQIDAVIKYVAGKRSYFGKNERNTSAQKYDGTLDIILGEFAKYYPSIAKYYPDTKDKDAKKSVKELRKNKEEYKALLLSLYHVLEKQTHYALMLDNILGWPNDIRSSLKEGVLRNIEPPLAIIRQSLKTPESFLEKMLRSKFCTEVLPPLDLYRFRVMVPSETDVRNIESMIVEKCNGKGWVLTADRKTEDYYANPKKKDGKESPYRSIHIHITAGNIPIEIQLRTFEDDYTAHTHPKIGEDVYLDQKKALRRSVVPGLLCDLSSGILEPESYARTGPARYINLLINRLEQEAQRQPSEKTDVKETLLDISALETALNFYDEFLQLPSLSEEDKNEISARHKAILNRYFAPLTDKQNRVAVYLPKLAKTQESLFDSELVDRDVWQFEHQIKYLTGLGLRLDETYKVISCMKDTLKEIIASAAPSSQEV